MSARGILICLLLCPLAWGLPLNASQSEQPKGLMWNRTGLPLVFPLQIKSAADVDYYMVLTDAETDTPALAAYIDGGAFFRVLVPPGTFDISFAAGRDWHGEEELFGREETQFFALSAPLTFKVLDRSTKGGHIIDIREALKGEAPKITVVAFNFCQGAGHQRVAPSPLPDNTPPAADETVGQEILERRFKRGSTVFEAFDRQRQQEDFDPPVLGLPRVPIERPQRGDADTGGAAQSTIASSGLRERPC